MDRSKVLQLRIFFFLWTWPKSDAIRAIWKKGLAWLEGIVGLAQPGLWLLWVAEGSEEQRGLGCPWGFLQTCHCTWDTVGLVSLDSIFSLTPQGSSGIKIIIILSIKYKCSGWDIYGINKRRKRTSIFPVGCAHCSAHWSSKQCRGHSSVAGSSLLILWGLQIKLNPAWDKKILNEALEALTFTLLRLKTLIILDTETGWLGWTFFTP